MARTIAIANQKGGVGKTTTAINLAASLAKLDHRVLIIDIDPQANATSGLGIAKGSSRLTSYHVLVLNEPIQNAVITTEFGVQLVPSDRNLAGAEIEMVDFPERELLLKKAVASISEAYDFIFIDCPPALKIGRAHV